MEIDDHIQLLQSMQQHMEAQDWPKALETVERLVTLEPESFARGTWYYRAGWICDEHLQQRDAAADHLNMALDCYFADGDALTDEHLPTVIKPFQALVRMFSAPADWKSLDRAYRKMIHRSKSPTGRLNKLQAALYDQLGALYQTYSPFSAMTCFEEAQRLDPGYEVRTPGIDREAILKSRPPG